MVNWGVPHGHSSIRTLVGVREVALWLTGQFHTNTQFHLVTFWCERGGFVVNWAVPHGHSSIGTLTGVREVALWLTGQFHTDTQFHTNTVLYGHSLVRERWVCG